MLPKNRRISRQLLKTIVSQRRHFGSQNFSLQIAPSDKAQFAVTVSKKVSKKAVIRNKIRRRTYSAIEKFIAKVKPNLYLIVAKPGAQNLKGEELKRELQALFVSYVE